MSFQYSVNLIHVVACPHLKQMQQMYRYKKNNWLLQNNKINGQNRIDPADLAELPAH